MAYREFLDEQGILWWIWDTQPQASRRFGVTQLQSGWLTFESFLERRRLVPAPEAWSQASDDKLQEWLASATAVKLRTPGVAQDAGTPSDGTAGAAGMLDARRPRTAPQT